MKVTTGALTSETFPVFQVRIELKSSEMLVVGSISIWK